MAKRNPEPEETRERIRGAAIELFCANGVHAASLNDIAAQARLSKGTLYYHFATKDELVLDIAERHFARISECIFAWLEQIDPKLSAFELLLPLTKRLLLDRGGLELHFSLMGEAKRCGGMLGERVYTKLREWEVMLELGALKMTGPGAAHFRHSCKSYVSLLNGFAMHMLIDEAADPALLLKILQGIDTE